MSPLTNAVNRSIVFVFVFILISSYCYSQNQQNEGKAPTFSFGVIADIQYSDDDHRGNRYYRNSLTKLKACVNDLNKKNLAFTIQLGDFIERGFENYDKVLPLFQQLTMPKYHVLGNHDFSVAKEKKSAVLKKIGLKNRYYSFIHRDWRFVILDGTDLSLYARPEESEEYREAQAIYQGLKEGDSLNAQVWNGGLGTRQIGWMQNTLNSACEAGRKVILFCHFPVFPQSRYNLWNDKEVVRMIESYDCVFAYINGHNHHGNYAAKKGIHYLTVQGMVDTPHQNAYAVVEFHGDRLKVCGVGRVPNRTLAIGQVSRSGY